MSNNSNFYTYQLENNQNYEVKTKIINEKDLSKDQKSIYDAIHKWMKDKDDKLLTFGGFSGVGKTTVLACLARKLATKTAFCAYTGKAASVLRKKMRENNVDVDSIYCGTIHGLIYIPVVDPKTKRILGWRKRASLDCDLIIVDEGSMVGSKLWADLLSYGKKILVTGDHAQLPPINSPYNLMDKPQLRLEKIHRQAEDNPIIKLSFLVRNGENIRKFKPNDPRVLIFENGLSTALLESMLFDMFKDPQTRLNSSVITYFNKTRILYNNVVRRLLNYQLDLNKDDTLICLKNTYNEESSIFNGMRGLVKETTKMDSHKILANIHFIDDQLGMEGSLCLHQFNQPKPFDDISELKAFGFRPKDWESAGLLFDFGYALTCHKSQGSTFQNILVHMERNSLVNDDMYRRWVYTAITRSADKLIMVY